MDPNLIPLFDRWKNHGKYVSTPFTQTSQLYNNDNEGGKCRTYSWHGHWVNLLGAILEVLQSGIYDM